MICCLNKNINSRSRNWVSLLNSVQMRQKRKVRPYREDGSGVTRSGGSRAWRNNNPGNIRSAQNEIGSAGGFAIFADYDTGFNAIYSRN